MTTVEEIMNVKDLPLMEQVVSSNIEAVGYAEENLYIRFTSGDTYKYVGVSAPVYAAFRADSSLGKSIRSLIIPRYPAIKLALITSLTEVAVKQPDCVVLLSGGADSTTLLYHVVNVEKRHPLIVSFNYGQKHNKELEYAAKTAAALGLKRIVLNLDLNQIGGSPLTDPTMTVPKQSDGKQRSTVVPYRNMLLLTMAAAAAEVAGVTNKPTLDIYHGACLEDYASYRDCRKDFISALSTALSLSGTEEGSRVSVLTPFVLMDKIQITQLGLDLGINYKDTHTCYANMEPPCGVCDSCKERAAAFDALGIADPKYTV